MNECLQIIVSGRVQGVYFRAFCQKQANRLNLSGYAKNLPDGDVEIIACGESSQLQQLLKWCHKGPLLAKVKRVKTTKWIPEEPFSGFEIL